MLINGIGTQTLTSIDIAWVVHENPFTALKSFMVIVRVDGKNLFRREFILAATMTVTTHNGASIMLLALLKVHVRPLRAINKHQLCLMTFCFYVLLYCLF